ncbi:MAG: MBL fold metallo-hydrolase [Candidatus Omnitrophica bacterium]|nr:MBL fold metallo-hydrolase [Candidatus Omnitrophota bacterium]
MILESVHVGAMDVNCYILASSEGSKAIIIDPGAQERRIQKVLDKHKLTPAFIVNTHGHYDHIGCDDKFGVKVYVHKLDSEMLKNPQLNFSAFFSIPYSVNSEIEELEEGSLLELDDLQLKVLHIPGHSKGGIALLMLKPEGSNIVFTGDSLFRHSIGRSDLNGGNEDLLKKNIKEKLLALPPETIVYPGHGDSTTISEEINNNPFFLL